MNQDIIFNVVCVPPHLLISSALQALTWLFTFTNVNKNVFVFYSLTIIDVFGFGKYNLTPLVIHQLKNTKTSKTGKVKVFK
jgi:hypothetical protein